MDTSFFRALRPLLPPLLLLQSCFLFEPELPSGQTRDDVGQKGTVTRRDTVLLVSAVSFPDKYDWQRDTAFGRVPFNICLYRDGKKELSVKAGPGTDFGNTTASHYIIGTSLFTVCSDSRGTRIGKNGRLVRAWKEKESLYGILEKDGALYTLGRETGSEGLTYRRDGNVVLKIDKAEPFGGFRTDGYGQTGALYEAGGEVCFAFSSALDGVTSVKLVRDGQPEVLLSAARTKVLDAKMIGNSPALLYNESGVTMMSYGGRHFNVGHSGGLLWKSASLVMFEGRVSALGSFVLNNEPNLTYGIGWENSCLEIQGSPDYLYCNGDAYCAVDPASEALRNYYFINRDCACQLGDGLVLALTPKNTSNPPRVKFFGREYSYPMNGYLTGVSCVIVE